MAMLKRKTDYQRSGEKERKKRRKEVRRSGRKEGRTGDIHRLEY